MKFVIAYPGTKQKKTHRFLTSDSALCYISSVMKILSIKDTLILSVPYLFLRLIFFHQLKKEAYLI